MPEVPICAKCQTPLIVARNSKGAPYVKCPKCKPEDKAQKAKTPVPAPAKPPGERRNADRRKDEPPPKKPPQPDRSADRPAENDEEDFFNGWG
jgi:DNA-directed RNA polymerase subunit M/transcription elongation factor TFIIS